LVFSSFNALFYLKKERLKKKEKIHRTR